MKNKKIVYTIGQGSKSIDLFLDLLVKNKIQFVVDVRTNPYSKFNPKFSISKIKNTLRTINVTYIHMGKSLGGKPEDESFYTNGYADYSKMATAKSFKESLQRIVNGANKDFKIALFCSEGKPEMCHRSKLIGQELSKKNIDIQHIEDFGNSNQKEVISRITKNQKNLFNYGFTSRNKYK